MPLYSATHGGEETAIYARGPMAHLFHATHEQNYIAHVAMYASCVGPNKDHCEDRTDHATSLQPVVWITLAWTTFVIILVQRT